MNHPQITEIGKIQRTHGVNGEVQINWANNFIPEEHNLESVFIKIDGIPIPFFIKQLRGKGANSSLVIFEDIDSINSADEFVGLSVFAEIKRRDDNDDELSFDELVGFTIITSKGVLLGTITRFEDYSGNLIFEVLNTAGHQVLIPASPDFIIEIDEDSKSMVMDIPEGLSEL